MKLQFRHQKFQADAARAVCDVFNGQPLLTPTYRMDPGEAKGPEQGWLDEDGSFNGFRNHPVMLSDRDFLKNLGEVQRQNQIKPDTAISSYSTELEDPLTARKERRPVKYNLTVEMETGVGKTYTYIKTIYELNKRYGWSKFIVIVPSVAIREGVHKSFEITQDHFAEEYGKKIHFFIYNSQRLTDIERFASERQHTGDDYQFAGVQCAGQGCAPYLHEAGCLPQPPPD